MNKPVNSYIITSGGISLNVAGKPYSVDATHIKYANIRDAVKAGQWDGIEQLIDVKQVVKNYVESIEVGYGDVKLDGETHQVLFNGYPVHNTIVDHIWKMLEGQFDIMPAVKFLNNLMRNPSNKAIQELYRWMETNGMTITEDGYLLAYKRVRDDYKSFHDGKTDNAIGSTPSMPRWQVDDRSSNTCSTGLHFCSQAYLPSYSGGRGRVLLLKIDPADVVSIPTDYNNAKGRACQYRVIGELKGDAREVVEVKSVMTQPVVAATEDEGVVDILNRTEVYKKGYGVGYRAGRGKQKNEYKAYSNLDPADVSVTDPDIDDKLYAFGYLDGYKDGRSKSAKLF